MSRADQLRAELAVAELEETYVAAKESGEHAELREDLRYARWVARGGPEQETARLNAKQGHTNRAIAQMYARWKAEN